MWSGKRTLSQVLKEHPRVPYPRLLLIVHLTTHIAREVLKCGPLSTLVPVFSDLEFLLEGREAG